MRPIKFRIWDSETKSMNYEPFADAYYESEHGCLINEFFKNPRLVFLQFTGLRDKNGKEIFEGDILKGIFIHKDNSMYGDDTEFPFDKCIVQYNDDYSTFAITDNIKTPIEHYKNFLYQATDIEVIGNVYENSELLKEPK